CAGGLGIVLLPSATSCIGGGGIGLLPSAESSTGGLGIGLLPSATKLCGAFQVEIGSAHKAIEITNRPRLIKAFIDASLKAQNSGVNAPVSGMEAWKRGNEITVGRSWLL